MGTTAEKGAYIIGTKSLLKQAINNIGGEVTDETTFRNYVAELENVYDNLPKTEYQEGTEITLSNTLKGKLDFDNGVVGIGQSSQDSTQGYQLLPFTNQNTSGSSNGIDWSLQDDGGIKIKGTSTAQVVIAYTRSQNMNLQAGTYIVSSTNFITNARFQIWYSTATLLKEIGQTAQTITISNDTTFENFRTQIVIPSGNTIDAVVYVQLEKGSTAHTFEKYTGGQASPNPSYPQEIKYVRGRNKLDVSKNTNGYVLSTTGELNQAEGYCVSDFIPVQQGATYNVSYKLLSSVQDANTTRVGFYDSSKTFISRPFSTDNPYIITIPSNCHYVRLSYQYPARSEMQFEEGTQATPYLPYNTIEEVVSGKNRLEAKLNTVTNNGITVTNNNDGTFTINGTNTSTSVVTFRLDEPNLHTYEDGTYTLDKGTTNTDIFIRLMQNETWAQIITVSYEERLKSQAITNATNTFIYIGIKGSATINNVTIKPMFVKGSYTVETIGNFEPYITPKSYQLSLGDIELNAIGNYKDELIYDVENDKVYKNVNVGKQILNGDETITLSAISDNTVRIRYSYDLLPYTAKGDLLGLCNRLLAKNIWDIDEEGFFFYGKQLIMRINKETVGTTPNSINAWLENNNMIFNYALETEVLEEITDTTLVNQVKALYNAHSNNGTTIITSNGNLPMIIKCRANTEGITPTGTKSITQNGTYDVKEYASANVNVSGIIPTGTLSITENGTYNVTNYASASVNVESSSYPPDWSLIGYSDTPPAITNGFNYAKAIYDNWDNTTTMFDFKAYTKLVIFPLIDTSNVNYMYQGLKDVVGLISFPLINTEKVTDMGNLFAGCRALVDVPVLATSRLSSWGFSNTFSNCLSLSDESLNNILRMCINATGVTGGYKSLRMIGLTNAQGTRCQSLSNYQEFLDAGWEPGF